MPRPFLSLPLTPGFLCTGRNSLVVPARATPFKLRVAIGWRRGWRLQTKEPHLHQPQVGRIGHGIDVEKLCCTPNGADSCAAESAYGGAVTPIKSLETLIEATWRLRDSDHAINVTLPGSGDGRRYSLCQRPQWSCHGAASGGPGDFTDMWPTPSCQSYATSDVSIGLTPPGGIDKVLIESMASDALSLLPIPSWPSIWRVC